MRTFLCWLAGCGLSATAGVVFAQQIKDWVKGIPAHAREEIAKFEADALARLKKGL